MKRGRKILCMLLAVILLVGTIPMAAGAVSGNTLLNIPWSYINQCGHQASSGPCQAYCWAYCRIILDNSPHTYNEYYISGVGGVAPATAGYQVNARLSSETEFLKAIYNEINKGRPPVITVRGSSRGDGTYNNHYVVCIGYRTGCNPNSLSTSDILILNPANSAITSSAGSNRTFTYLNSCIIMNYGYFSAISGGVSLTDDSGASTPPPHTHTWDNGRITTAPTESSTGIRTYTCTGCGATKTETVAKLPHTHKWDNGKVTKEATVSATGVLTYTCTGCGQTKTETIPIITKADGKCGDNVTWSYDGTTRTLTLSGTGSTYDYNPWNDGNNPAPWYNGSGIYSAIRNIIISPGITTIGENLFFGCSQADSVSIPASVEFIGRFAFRGCSSLDTITIPKGKIGRSAFAYCPNLRSVTLQEGVTEIEKCAFDAGSEASIKSIWIPSTIVKLHGGALRGIQAIDVSENNPAYTIQNGVVYSKDMTELVHYPQGKTDTRFVIPSGVEIVKDFAVNFNWFLKEFVVPEGVTTLERYAFASNYNVTSVTLPRSLKTVGEAALVVNTDFFRDIYYGGTESEWQAIDFSHAAYPSIVTVHFTEEDPDFSGNKPTAADFSDVLAGDYYADAVQWAVENGITSGTDATHFSPGAGCTRAQAVTFLWRAAGEPEPKGTAARFTDVKAGAYYEKAVRWAVEQGITSGTSATRFSPNATCTRAQIVTFLWRREGSPEADGNSFSDVKTGEYYENAVKWAVKQGITSGTSATRFSPNSNCVRAQIVTFLYRYEA